MAEASIEKVTKKVTVEEEVEVYRLDLTRDEALTIYALTGIVSGRHNRTPSDAIYYAVQKIVDPSIGNYNFARGLVTPTTIQFSVDINEVDWKKKNG